MIRISGLFAVLCSKVLSLIAIPQISTEVRASECRIVQCINEEALGPEQRKRNRYL